MVKAKIHTGVVAPAAPSSGFKKSRPHGSSDVGWSSGTGMAGNPGGGSGGGGGGGSGGGGGGSGGGGGTPGQRVAFVTQGLRERILDNLGEMGYGTWVGSAFDITGTNPWNRGGYSSVNPTLTPGFLASIQAAGFTCILVAFDPGPLKLALQASDLTTFNRLMGQLQTSINLIKAAGLKVIARFTIRPDTSVQATGYGLAVSEVLAAAPTNGADWSNYNNMLHAACGYLAANNDPTQVALEPINEPPGTAWNNFAPVVFATCRNAAPMHTIIIQGQLFGTAAGLTGMMAASFDANTMFCFHQYDEFRFVFQSQIGAPVGGQYISGMEWPPVQGNKAGIIAAATTRINVDGTLSGPQKTAMITTVTNSINVYYTRDATFPPSQWQPAMDWADAQGVARNQIIMGEFSCSYTSAYNYAGTTGAPTGSLQAYLGMVTAWCASHGIHWGYWNAVDATNFGESFTIAPGVPPVLDNTRLSALGLVPQTPPPPALYVANGGSDGAAGTIDAPFASVPHGLSVASSGSIKIVKVRGGTYNLTSALAIDAGVTLIGYENDTPKSAIINNTVSGSGATGKNNITVKNLTLNGTANDGGGVMQFNNCDNLTFQSIRSTTTGWQVLIQLFNPGSYKIQGINWTGPTVGNTSSHGIFPINVTVNDGANYVDPDGYIISDCVINGATFPVQIERIGADGIWKYWHCDRVTALSYGDATTAGTIGNIGISIVGSNNPANAFNTCEDNNLAGNNGFTTVGVEAGLAGCTYRNKINATFGYSISDARGALFSGSVLTVDTMAFSQDGAAYTSASAASIEIRSNTVNGAVRTGAGTPTNLSPLPTATGLPTNAPSTTYTG